MYYVDDRGRFMVEGSLGQLTVRHPGRTFAYFLLNVLHGGVWFATHADIARYAEANAV